ncbi:hypothetical protein H4219_000893 [Mycoemilia scoparia]|uniref:Dihydrofolate reductase n=1 Tax=Mycoemilia scoparia TaxID=417184 RepID=A0A9W8A7Z3_9FUNG|nr:hypothetical protein H4219_000893 [Mycoemilia scoparia]
MPSTNTPKRVIKVIVAAAQNNAIGRNSDIPWQLKNELAYFTKMTRTIKLPKDLQKENNQVTKDATYVYFGDKKKRVLNACIMGRRSWESIPLKFRPLNHRYNIVLTSNKDLLAKENSPLVAQAKDLDEALQLIDELNNNSHSDIYIQDVFAIGGHGVYKASMESPNQVELFLTRVQFPEADSCDTFFPEINSNIFSRQSFEALQERVPFEIQKGVVQENGLQYEYQLFLKS